MQFSIKNKLPGQFSKLADTFKEASNSIKTFDNQVEISLSYGDGFPLPGPPSALMIMAATSTDINLSIAANHRLTEMGRRYVLITTDFETYNFKFHNGIEMVYEGTPMSKAAYESRHPADIVRWILEYILNNVQDKKPGNIMMRNVIDA